MEKFKIKAMCHITGGGFIENVPRMLPKNKTAVILKDSYEIPEIFKYMMNLGVEKDHMYNTFNMVCIDKSIKDEVLAELQAMGEKAYEIGYITCGEEGVCLK